MDDAIVTEASGRTQPVSDLLRGWPLPNVTTFKLARANR